jgi:hypothetical protein
MARGSRSVVLLAAALVMALALPTLAAGKRKPPPPPPPPPDSAADCSLFVEPAIGDYLVLATLNLGVRCATTKQTITVTASSFTRDGADVPLLPYDTLSCTSTAVCVMGIDLFSYDNHPVAFPGDQRYCVSGFGVVGGQTVGPGSGCEEDARI